MRTVFFFARSPEAPRTTMMVLSLSSTVLELKRKFSQYPRKVTSFHQWRDNIYPASSGSSEWTIVSAIETMSSQEFGS